MPEKIIYIDGVGSVIFRHSKKARYLNISVRPFAGVRVSVPTGISYDTAIIWAAEKKSWIRKHLSKIKDCEEMLTRFDESSVYSTKNHTLNLHGEDRKNISVKLSEARINVVYPAELNPGSEEVQSAVRKGIERALKTEAKEYLPDKVKKSAEKYKLSYNKLTLKNIRSRWGSCSGRNNINLSIHLMRLPEHLIDYVILHELVHTVHHNHSERFWNMLNSLTGNARSLDRELKKYRIAIY